MTYPTQYVRPSTFDEALTAAAQPSALALAGGALTFTTLDLPYATVIDLQGIAELRQIERSADLLTLGSAVSLQAVVEADAVPLVLRRALTRAVPLNLRAGASVGESLIAARPPLEWLTALAACGAEVEHTRLWQTDKLNSRELWRETVDVFGAVVQREGTGGIVVARVFVPLREQTVVGTAHVARTPADAPIVCVAAAITLDGDRIRRATVAVGGASEVPVVVHAIAGMTGSPFDDANIASAAKSVAAAVDPVGDWLGSVEYRREMARLLTVRALEDARAQR